MGCGYSSRGSWSAPASTPAFTTNETITIWTVFAIFIAAVTAPVWFFELRDKLWELWDREGWANELSRRKERQKKLRAEAAEEAKKVMARKLEQEEKAIANAIYRKKMGYY